MSAVPDITMPGSLPLVNITGTTPPTERITRPSDARDMVGEFVDANKKRAEFYALCEGQLDGNSPFDPSTLRSHGQQWRTNVSTLDAEAMAESAMTPYYDLFAGGKYYAEVVLSEDDPDAQWQHSSTATDAFQRLLKKWRSFHDQMYACLFDRMYHGKGFPMFPDDDDWRFEYVPQHRVLVPDATEPDPDKAECIVVRQRLTVTRLWQWIRDKDTAEARGWNVNAVARAMRFASPDELQRQNLTGDNYVEVQNWLRDKDISESAKSERVRIAHVYIREFSGKVSHYIVTEEITPGEPTDGEWLFRKVAAYDNMRQCIAPMFYETRRNSWNGSAGMAKRTYSVMELSTRLFCSMMDGAFLRAGITLQAKSQRSRQSTALVQVGGFNIVPPEYDVQQSTIMGDLQGTMATARYLEDKLASNTGTFRQRLEPRDTGNPPTAEEVRLRFQSAAILGNSAVNRFYDDVDPLYAEMYRRAVDPKTTDKDAKEFQKECLDAGIPAKVLRNNYEVLAYRQLGNGSIFMRQQAISGSFPLVPLMNEAGRQNWLDDAISVTASHATVSRWNPRSNPAMGVERDQWDAMVENDCIKDGAPVMWNSKQNNIVHSQQHLLAAAQAAESVQQGGNPVNVLAFMQGELEHTAQHLKALSQDKYRRDATAALSAQYRQLAQVATELQSQVEDAMKQQQEGAQTMAQAQAVAQGTDPDTALKTAETKHKMKLQAAKTQQAMALKGAKARQDMAISDIKTAQQVRNSGIKPNAQ